MKYLRKKKEKKSYRSSSNKKSHVKLRRIRKSSIHVSTVLYNSNKSSALKLSGKSHKRTHKKSNFSDNPLELLSLTPIGQSNMKNAGLLVELYEWLGDAVLDEVVARCLLSQFYHTQPLSARVFRNVRLAIVTNVNLAKIFDQLYPFMLNTNVSNLRIKQKADIVEAVVGEIIMQLQLAGKKEEKDLYQNVLLQELDRIVSHLFHEYINYNQARLDQEKRVNGEFQLSWNAFTCLPIDEVADDEDDEKILEALDVVAQSREEIDEVDDNEMESLDDTRPYHYFRDFSTVETSIAQAELSSRISFLQNFIEKEMKINSVLRESREIFNVFKSYGMSVLKEKMSCLLIQKIPTTPANLTRTRQKLLSILQLASCSIEIGLTPRDYDSEEGLDTMNPVEANLRANSLRAFIGYFVASSPHHLIADYVTSILFTSYMISTNGDETSISSPPHDNYSFTSSRSEARRFLTTKLCDELHQPNERPQANNVKNEQSMLEHLFHQQSEKLDHLTDFSKFENIPFDGDKVKAPQRKKKMQAALKRTKVKWNNRKLKSNVSQKSCIPVASRARLDRFIHRKFLYHLENLLILFITHQVDEWRRQLLMIAHELEPCAISISSHWKISCDTININNHSNYFSCVMRGSFYRLLLHDLCHYHGLEAQSHTNSTDGIRITKVRVNKSNCAIQDYLNHDYQRLTNAETAVH